MPRPRDEVFAFFADARNLALLTPPDLRLQSLTPPGQPMQSGALVDYQIRLWGIPLRWQSRIQCWDPPREFVDVQTRGPYRSWEHIHTFLEQDGGTLCRDEVRYTVWGGTLVDLLFVRRELRRIFSYRTEQLTRLLPATTEEALTPNPPVGSRFQNSAAPFCAQVHA